VPRVAAGKGAPPWPAGPDPVRHRRAPLDPFELFWAIVCWIVIVFAVVLIIVSLVDIWLRSYRGRGMDLPRRKEK